MSSIREVVRTLTTGGRRSFAMQRWLLQQADWPPDVFAVTSLLLARSGAYRFCVSPPTPSWRITKDRKRWERQVQAAADAWHRALARRIRQGTFSTPEMIRKHVERLAQVQDEELRALGDARAVAGDRRLANACLSLLFLHASADTVCAGWGVPWRAESDEGDFAHIVMELVAERAMASEGSLSRFDPDLVRVLPKLRTPRAGISVRSLSHHLAFHQGETKILWKAYPATGSGVLPASDQRLNLLLVPWPEVVHPSAFTSTRRDGSSVVAIDLPNNSAKVIAHVQGALETCRERGLETHGIVFPEASLSKVELEELCASLAGR